MRFFRAIVAGCLLLAATGCSHHFFKVDGALESDGAALGTWRTKPIGCSRDPVPPPPAGRFEDVATFLWDDSLLRSVQRRINSPDRPEKPARLELWRRLDGPNAGKIYGRLELQDPVSSKDLNPSVCASMMVRTSEGKTLIEGGRPTLQGALLLECEVGDSRLRGDLEFSGCEY